jgi:hypothetical protein
MKRTARPVICLARLLSFHHAAVIAAWGLSCAGRQQVEKPQVEYEKAPVDDVMASCIASFLDDEDTLGFALVLPSCTGDRAGTARLVFERGVLSTRYGPLLYRRALMDFARDWARDWKKPQEDFGTDLQATLAQMDRKRVEFIQRLKPNECINTSTEATIFKLGQHCALYKLAQGKDFYLKACRGYCQTSAKNTSSFPLAACEQKAAEAYAGFVSEWTTLLTRALSEVEVPESSRKQGD